MVRGWVWGAGAAALLLAGVGGVGVWQAREIVDEALVMYPTYQLVRTRNEALRRISAAGYQGLNLLVPRDTLAGPANREVTTPNNDTLYAFAFLDLTKGPVRVTMPPLPGRYHSLAVMDLETNNDILTGTRDGGMGDEFVLMSVPFVVQQKPSVKVRYLSSAQGWLLIRVLVDGESDLAAARAALRGFKVAPLMSQPALPPLTELPVEPTPALLIDTVAAAWAGEGRPTAFVRWADRPAWQHALWALILPRITARLQAGISEGAARADGWSLTPPGIGTAAASPEVRAAVALGGLGALPADEAIYWRAAQDAGGAALTGAARYTLTIPAKVPARAFWSLSMYERLPDGRLFYGANPLKRYAVGDRTPGLRRNADGSLTLTLSHARPADATNWLPAPAGAFNLIFRAYLPGPEMRDGRFRLPAVRRAA